MIIKRTEAAPEVQYAYLNIFPDQFKTEKEKQSKSVVKNTMDFFANIAYSQYRRNRDTFVKNYDLLKGKISMDDFYAEDKEIKPFIDVIWQEQLPSYVKHYSILNPPLATMVGEMSKRPDTHRVRAFDDESQSAEMEFRTEKMQELILQQARQTVYRKLSSQGIDIEEVGEDKVEELSIESIKDEITDYTSKAEDWANQVLVALKARFNMKEKSEEMFRDLLAISREYGHIFEDNSKVGFNVEVVNAKNYWQLGTPDSKYTSGASGQQNVPYANGLVHVMEISEIIEKETWLTKEEIDHLRTSRDEFGLISARESNITSGKTGWDSITYDTYDKLVLEERMLAEADMKENRDELKDWLGVNSSNASFGYKYTVVKAYFQSKKKIGELTYMDEEGNIHTTLVDETYREGSPNEIDIRWGWVNQLYQGTKIGSDVYNVRPFELLDYSPIIGLTHEVKNTEAKSLVDMMKPYQILFNVCMNQLWERLEKDWGKVYKIQIRRVPTPKDADAQDALAIWEEEARQRGIVWEDDSPENLKAPISNTQTSAVLDMSRHDEIQVRYNLAVQLQEMCWALVGVNRERLGGSQTTQTATGVQSNLTQSFAQTEPYFIAHQYVMDQIYQGIIDAAQYIESKKPFSTISYITSEGTAAAVRVTGEDIRMRDLWVLNTSNPEDQKLFEEIRALAQPMLQNGATTDDIINLYSTNSMRQMKKISKDLRERQEAIQQQMQEIEERKLQQAQEAVEAQLAETARQAEIDRINDNYNKEQDRLSKEKIAIISALGFGKTQGEDQNANNVPDVMEATRLSTEIVASQKEFEIKLREIEQKEREIQTKREVDLEALKVDRENQKNDIQIERIRAKAKKSQAKAKPKPKKK